ncbi:MAG: methyltransferase domain-containing protein [Firmicutes bacterium]|nr:methyltransferase domain-containing protein [Bacillota bacterium]
MRNYQWSPGEYAQSSSEQQRWARENMARLGLRGDERILDIGCGDGKVTAELARLASGGSVLGIDSSESMVEHAREKFPPGDNPNLGFGVGDARTLGYREEFDLVVSFACLHWVIDHRPVLAGIEAGLKPGGRVFLQFGGAGNAAEVVEVIDAIISGPKWSGYFQGFEFPYGFYGIERYREWLDQTRLVVERIELVPKDMVHQGTAGLRGWLRTTWLPYLERLPAEIREEFIDETAQGYLAEHPADEAGMVHVKMVRLEVEAHKA